jgi:molecular chaperone DnaK
MLQEMGDKLPSSDKAAVESAVESLKTAISGGDTAAMTRAMEQLTQAQHKAAETLYKTTGATGSPGAEGAPGAGPQGSTGPEGSAGPAGSGDVIDAEVVDDK